MEIRTCEEYVVTELMRKEDELNKCIEELRVYKDQVEALNSQISNILRMIKPNVDTATDGITKYISFDTIWESYDKQDYAELYALLKARGIEVDGNEQG